VCIIPFLVNRATEAMDVVKFYEYASQGKPVVSTGISEIIQYKDYIYLAEADDDFLVKLDAAVAEQDPQLREKRTGLARKNTWHDRVTDIRRGIRRAQRLRATSELLRDLNGVALRDGAPAAELSLHLKAGLEEREQAVQILSSRLASREGTLKHLNRTIAELTQVKASLGEQINELIQSKASLGGQINELIQSKETLLQQVSEREHSIAALQTEAANAEASLNALGADIVRATAEIELLRQKAVENEQSFTAALQMSGEMTRTAAGLKAHLAEESRRAEVFSIQLAEAERKLESLRRSRGLRIINRLFRKNAFVAGDAARRAGSIEARREGRSSCSRGRAWGQKWSRSMSMHRTGRFFREPVRLERAGSTGCMKRLRSSCRMFRTGCR
jgi:chromosome segregation ATPase